MERLTAVVRWLRVHHLGAPRWFLASVALLVTAVGAVLATHWGQ
jgi:phosphate starvation-inducible membrane PsiE